MANDIATTDPAARRSGISRSLVLLFAVSCGVSVANLYYAQPVLDDIAKSFGTSSGTAGLVVTFAQIGYAMGLALLVPLGDLLTRRWLVPLVLAVTAVGLVVSASAPANRRGPGRRGRVGGRADPRADGRLAGR